MPVGPRADTIIVSRDRPGHLSILDYLSSACAGLDDRVEEAAAIEEACWVDSYSIEIFLARINKDGRVQTPLPVPMRDDFA